MRTMSPASMATSVPVPTAIPRSARGQGRGVVDAVADEGHGLARLPGVGQLRRPCRRAALRRAPVSMPTWAAMASAVRRLSPVSMTARRRVRAACVDGLPATLPAPCRQRRARRAPRRPSRRGSAVLPCRSIRLECVEVAIGDLESLGRPSAWPCRRRLDAVDTSDDAAAGDRVDVGRDDQLDATFLGAEGDAFADGVLAGRLDRADEVEEPVLVSSVTTSLSVMAPRVSVPVLSKTTVSIVRERSKTSAPLNSTPSSAPRPDCRP